MGSDENPNIAAALAHIRQELDHWNRNLPVLHHIWSDPGDMDGEFAGRFSTSTMRRVVYLADMEALMKAWLNHNEGDAETIKGLLGQVPKIVAGLRDVAALAGARHERYRKNRRVQRLPVGVLALALVDVECVLDELEVLKVACEEFLGFFAKGELSEGMVNELEADVSEMKERLWNLKGHATRWQSQIAGDAARQTDVQKLQTMTADADKLVASCEEDIKKLRTQTKEVLAMAEIWKELQRMSFSKRASREGVVGVS